MLVESPAFFVAIATGGWRPSALYKLGKAGYDLADVPIASADDSSSRPEILRTAAERARALNDGQDFRTTTYIGDGVWDARAARTAGYRFIGRGDPDTSALLTEGAVSVVCDFSDVDALLRLVADT